MEASHDSVFVSEVQDVLAVESDDVVVDATLGGAGHFADFLSRLGAEGLLIGIDADAEAVERARETYARDRRTDRPVTHLVNDNFRNLARILERLSVGTVDKVFFDLGWSGYQIAAPRGFSFQRDEPLVMSYGETGETAADVVNSTDETALAHIIFTLGEERFSRQIARAIVKARARARILTTGALVEVIESAVPGWYRRGRIHPATKTFQALRIFVNDELESLKLGLSAALEALAPRGRVAVITFHSLEDRIVKQLFRDAAFHDVGTIVTKKPLLPSREEILRNRRARSAKLRIFERADAPIPVVLPTDAAYV